jgi:hypothetical protein
MPSSIVDTRFRLTAQSCPPVDVRLRLLDARWVAVADVAGTSQIGLGRTAREAITASLGSLSADARRALLADVALVVPSLAIRRTTAAR